MDTPTGRMKIAILGAGYVGLTTAVALAYLDHHVTCIEVDPARVAMLRRGETPIFEPGLDELLGAMKDRLAFASPDEATLDGTDVVFIAVGTPSSSDGSPDLRYVRAAAAWIGQRLGERFTVVVNKSTVPIGSGNWVESLVRDAVAGSGTLRGNFAVASNPEFLREGCALSDSLYPDRIVVGCEDPRAGEVLRALYSAVIEQRFEPPRGFPRPAGATTVPFVLTGLASAELVKYAANAFLALKISFINEIGEVSERVGADIAEVARGIGLDQRIGSRFLQAGVGWGGSCFGKDTAALAATGREYGLPMKLVHAAREVNFRQRERVIEKLLGALKILNGRTVGLLGLAFKPDTDDLRDSPAIELARLLAKRGVRVRAHDPVAMPRTQREHPNLEAVYCERGEDVATGAEAVILVTEWAQYRALDWARMAGAMRAPRIVLDARNVLDPALVAGFGMVHLGMGR